jgi:type IV pilus assembly protein PilC
MATFSYKAKSQEGKDIAGKIEGRNKKEAVQILSKMDLIVYRVEPINDLLNKEITIGKRLKSKDFVVFLRQFSTLIEAGILLVDAVELLAEQTESETLQQALENIADDIKAGQTLSGAMSHYPELFPVLLIQMIRSGEVSGQLDDVLERMATYYEKQHTLKQKVSTALTYPIVVASFAIIVTFFLLVAIVPVFADMYTQMGEELPVITQFVLGLSKFMRNFWWLFVVLGIAMLFVYRRMRQEDKGSYYLDFISLRLPIIGDFVQKAALARMTQTLSSLLNSSVPILQAVEVTSKVVGNEVIQNVLLDSRASLERGDSLAKPMEKHWAIPPLITQMIRVGEQSGALDEMLKKVADIYEQEVNEASDKLQALIEPVLIIFLAVIVVVIVLAIVIPMFALFETY